MKNFKERAIEVLSFYMPEGPEEGAVTKVHYDNTGELSITYLSPTNNSKLFLANIHHQQVTVYSENAVIISKDSIEIQKKKKGVQQ